MSWPDVVSFVPEALRGGPIPPDVAEHALAQLRDAWRKHAARRVHGAEERALALVALPEGAAPYVFIFDGRGCEAASPALGTVDVAMAELAHSGLIIRQGGCIVWRESLTSDQALARWRQLGGDEAFTLPPSQVAGRGPVRAYVLVRRGQDRAHVELDALPASANQAIRAWAKRFEPYLRTDLRQPLLG